MISELEVRETTEHPWVSLPRTEDPVAGVPALRNREKEKIVFKNEDTIKTISNMNPISGEMVEK